MNENKIYLKLNRDKTWISHVSHVRPPIHYVELTAEKEYPVEIYYRRNDMNGSGVVEADTCNGRQELLKSLDWIGKCGYTLLSVWDYDIDNPIAKNLESILDAVYYRRYGQEQVAAADMYEAVMEDGNASLSWSFTLDNGLMALVECRNPQEGGPSGVVYDFNIWEPDEDGSRGNLYSGGELTKQEGITSLSGAVEWVFQHYSREALMARSPVVKEPLDVRIQTAAKRAETPDAKEPLPPLGR